MITAKIMARYKTPLMKYDALLIEISFNYFQYLHATLPEKSPWSYKYVWIW